MSQAFKNATSGAGTGNILSINSDATAAQTLSVGTSGTDFAIVDNAAGGHAFNLPDASASARGAVTTGTQTIAGAKTFTGTVTTNTTYIQSALEYDAGNSGTAITLNWSNGSAQKVTMTGNCTFTFSNPVTGASYLLKLVQDATGARTYTWPAAVKWSDGTAPTGSAATKTDLISLYYDGTSYYPTSSLNH